MDQIDEIKSLVDRLNEASDAYYNSGNPIMSDTEFDIYMDRLKKMEQETGVVLSNSPTRNVGAEVKTSLNKVTHQRPMLSLDKCHSEQELIDFAGNDDCYLSVKCDGLSTRLIYKNGELVSAATRGNGQVGVDVLFHIKEYTNVPLTIPYTDEFVIDGESVIFASDFEKINNELPEDKKFKNPRNLASGTLAGLDASVTKKRHMRFIAWRVIKGFDTDSNFFKLKEAKNLGFTIVPMWTYTNNSSDKDNLHDMLDNLKKQAQEMGLPLDGAVMAKNSNSLSESMGRTEKFFRHSIAYKYNDDVYETKLQYIDWTLGRSGILTPTAVFTPIEIDGTEVSRASLHNVSIMRELGLTNHCTVSVFKANCIIPQISFCENDGDREIEIPTVCPVCGGATKIVCENTSNVLMCTNPDCVGKKLGQFTHFCSRNAMNIDGLSEKTLELLISHKFIHNFIDIYYLYEHKNELMHLDGLGKKSVENLLKSIEDSRNVKMENFLCALGIDGVGLSTAKILVPCFDGTIKHFKSAADGYGYDFAELEGIGETTSYNINKYLREHINEMIDLENEMNFIVEEKPTVANNALVGKTIVVTGKLNKFTRDSINEKIVSIGAKTAGSVSKKSDYLLTNEASESSKYKKAVELGIPIITEEEFINMIGE